MKPVLLSILSAGICTSCKTLPVPVSVAWTQEVAGKEIVAGYHSETGIFLSGKAKREQARAFDDK